MVQVSEDIFYQVKKEILDKLDVILQKVNLEIINYIKPESESFSFIELSSFEQELTHLFHYLDRLYASLNSSVSFSSIQSYKSTVENYQAENQRLNFQNQQLKQIIKQIKSDSGSFGGSAKSRDGEENRHQDIVAEILGFQLQKLQNLKIQVKKMSAELKGFGKQLKKLLKNYKFQMLQSRVQIISKLKDYELSQHEKQAGKSMQNDPKWSFLLCQKSQQHIDRDGSQIIERINQILSMC